MSRSDYHDDPEDQWQRICWRGAVASAIRGKRGQALLLEMAAALDAMPERELIAHELVEDGKYCALGVVGAKRGIALADIDPDDYDTVANAFDVSPALVREIEYVNDEWSRRDATPGERWNIVRQWVQEQLRGQP